MKKRILSLLMAVLLFCSVLPTAHAATAGVPIYLGFWDADAMAEIILDEIGARQIPGDYERIAAVYDWIIKNCSRTGVWDKEYIDYDALMARQTDWSNRFLNDLSQGKAAVMTSFTALDNWWDNGYNTPYTLGYYAAQMAVYRTGDCLYYASLLSLLLMHLGYENYVIPGDFINRDGSSVMHKWNMVYVGGTPYWLDVRMDHAAYNGGKVPHTYFMQTADAEWAKRHTWDHSYTDAIRAQHNMGRHPYIYMGIDNTQLAPSQWSKCSAWAQNYLSTAQQIGLIPDILKNTDMTQSITREEFAALAVTLYEGVTEKTAAKASGNPFTDCTSADVLKAYNLGIVNGTSATTFEPSGFLTREQGAAMLGRTYEAIVDGRAGNGSDLDTSGATAFADDGNISSYAKAYVGFMNANGIIDGIGNGRFDPWGKLSREAAIKIAVTMLTNLEF